MKTLGQVLSEELVRRNLHEKSGYWIWGQSDDATAEREEIGAFIISEHEARQWRDIPGWEGEYKISSGGVIKRQDGSTVGTWLNDQGYEMARLSNPRQIVRVHQLVCIAFVPNPDGKPSVNHKNSNRADNRVENLEWCTQSENILHAHKAGRMYKHPKGRPQGPLSEETVAKIFSLYQSGTPQSAIASYVGTNRKTIYRILRGKSYIGFTHFRPLPAPPKEGR